MDVLQVCHLDQKWVTVDRLDRATETWVTVDRLDRVTEITETQHKISQK